MSEELATRPTEEMRDRYQALESEAIVFSCRFLLLMKAELPREKIRDPLTTV